MEKAFEIKLPQFEGPFDLLLFFIERDEIDIHNIPIAKITNDFLDYIHQMEELNIDVASEFILVAATLMRIKARLLIPRPDLDEEGNEIDPRKDLIERLMVYRQFKEATQDLSKLEEERALKTIRGNLQHDLAEIAKSTTYADELQSLTLYHLLNSFEKVLKRFDAEQNKSIHTIVPYPYTIEEQRDFVINQIRTRAKLSFTDLLYSCKNKVHAIFTFLAILELLQTQAIKVTLGLGFNNFWLTEN